MQIAAEGCIPEEQKFYCPNAHCSALLSQEDSYPDKPLQCPECNKFVCAVCEVLWHKDMVSPIVLMDFCAIAAEKNNNWHGIPCKMK